MTDIALGCGSSLGVLKIRVDYRPLTVNALPMPIRSYAQQIGDAGQALVEDLFRHPRWVARTQSHDFGIDLEAELADPIEGHKQRMTGKLIKVQIKASAKVEQGLAKITYSVPRALIHYADAFRRPVILAIACLETRTVWWLWLQEWSMLNEERLGRNPEAATLTAHIPVDQTLERDLTHLIHCMAGIRKRARRNCLESLRV